MIFTIFLLKKMIKHSRSDRLCMSMLSKREYVLSDMGLGHIY